MYRLPVRSRIHYSWINKRHVSSSNFIRSTFIEYFVKNHDHKLIKSSSVVPLSDNTVPFVNAGMNQFKGIFLGKVDAPCPRVVNSQKCVRVGGKHNDLEVVGTDGHHHTFFEMLGNWSFGDYYKKDACKMAWDLLLGPYRLKPENLVVTYFSGDAVLGLPEDTECRDIWKAIGVPKSQLKPQGALDNFWEMGATGPCGPCTEIHYINPDGSLTEIWNIVFIQCNRVSEGKVTGLRQYHVDTGMGLERMAAILQNVPSNYDTDLFKPIITAIEKNSKDVSPYTDSYTSAVCVDAAYRRLADHARMIAVCLADSVFPASSLNLKQIMRKSFKLSTDVFHNPALLHTLYDVVSTTLGEAYPELVNNQKQAKLIIDHEQKAYMRLRADLAKKWKNLESRYPEVETLSDVELPGFTQGYSEFKEIMTKQKSSLVPGEVVFKLYDTHGFQEELIERIAKLNNYQIDKKGFWSLLTKHRTRHKQSMKEQTDNKSVLFDKAIQEIISKGTKSTNDSYKYDYKVQNGKLIMEPLKTTSIALLNEDCEWLDYIEPDSERPYYIVTKETNLYCEEGGQISDTGVIQCTNKNLLIVDSVFKIRDFVFHKGYFKINKDINVNYIRGDDSVVLSVNCDKRLNVMRNHTGVHLVNAAVRKVLPNSVVSQTGSSATDKGFSLSLSVYGEKLSHEVVIEAEDLIRETIKSKTPLHTKVLDGVQLSLEDDVIKIPGERYPEQGLRLVAIDAPGLHSRELCCGTHLSNTSELMELCITTVKGAGGNAPTIHALTGDAALEALELFCKAQKLEEVVQFTDHNRCKKEADDIKRKLVEVCGSNGAPYGQYASCIHLLDNLHVKASKADIKLKEIAEAEIKAAQASAIESKRKFVVHFVRCSYLMSAESVGAAMCSAGPAPTLLLGCAGGVLHAVSNVPKDMVTDSFNASRWLRCILPVFQADIVSNQTGSSPLEYAQMTPTKVSLINCENLVQDAMRVAIKFAQAQLKDGANLQTEPDHDDNKDRQHN